MKFFQWIFVLLCAVQICGAEKNLVSSGIAVKNGKTPLEGIRIVPDAAAPGQWCFQASAGRYYGTELIPVDPQKNLFISGRFRAAGQCGRFNLGLDCFDGNKRKIGMHHVQPIENTLTVLSTDADKGDYSINIANGADWEKIPGKIAVFDAKKDLSDLPNFNTNYYVVKVVRKDSYWQVTFNRPLRKSWKKGTAVRLHRDGGMLNAIAFVQPQTQWKVSRNLIEKVSYSSSLNEHLWPGTKYVKLNFYIYPGDPVQFNDLQLISREPEKIDENDKYDFRGSRLIKYFKPQHVLRSDKSMGYWDCSISHVGILCGEKLNLDAEKIKQIEMKFSAKGSPGVMLMTYDAFFKGKKISAVMTHTIPPDGKDHVLIFETGKENTWQGTISNIKFIYYASDPAEISFKSIRCREKQNLIADAENLVPGKFYEYGTLWPRGEYTLSWEGKENPGVSVEMFDRNYKKIGKAELNENAETCNFTVPEMCADTRVSIKAKGDGFPVITRKSWQERHQLPIKWNASWMWNQIGPGPENTTVWMRKKFNLEDDPQYAVIAMSVDDKFIVYVNGRQVGSGWPYFVTFRFDIAKFLKKGENEIVIRAYNGETWGGAVMEGYIKAGKQELRINSGEDWDCHVGGETMPEKYLKKTVSLGAAALASPWGNRITLRYIGVAAGVKVTKAEGNTFTGEVISIPPIHRERMRMKAVSVSGREWFINPKIEVISGKWEMGSQITIRYAAPYPENESYKLYCDDDFFSIKNNTAIGHVPAQTEIRPLSTVKVKNTASRPLIEINGEDIYPLFWQFPQRYSVESFQPTLGDAAFARSPIVGIPIYAEDSMHEDGSFSFKEISEKIAVLLNENPKVFVKFNAYLYMPQWWLKKFPDHRGRTREGVFLRPGYDTALASLKWREYVKIYIRELVGFVKKQSWGHKVIGMSLYESSNSEWFWRTQAGEGGFSPADMESYRIFLKRKYGTVESLRKAWSDQTLTFETIDWPGAEKVRSASVGALLDPLKDRPLMDWFEFRSVIFSEQIMSFAKYLKEATDNKWLAGAYYGYYIEFAASGSRSNHDHGHNGFLEVARCRDVDFVRAPSRYSMRTLGMADGIMQIPGTFQFRGKIVYIEQDFRSFTGNEREGYHGRHNRPIDTVGALNRAFAMMLATGCSQYILDFGRWLYEPMLLDILREQRQTFDSLPQIKGNTPAEVAVISSRDSVYYTKINSYGALQNSLYGLFMRKINYQPFPFTQAALEDLLEPGVIPPHKLYILMAPVMMTSSQRAKLMERFDREHAAVIFIHSAGETYPDKTPSAANCGDFLGIKMRMELKNDAPEMFYGSGRSWKNYSPASPFFYPVSGFDKVIGRNGKKEPVMVMKKIGNAVVYFTAQSGIPVELLTELAVKAGVRIYGKVSDDIWWIGNDIVGLYLTSDGEKSVTLPKGMFMEQIAGPVLPKKVWQSGEKFSGRSGQTYIFLVKNK